MAWVKLCDGAAPLTIGGLREFCDGKLAHYKIPRYLKLAEVFPMTVTGKVRKVELRERSIAELGLLDAAATPTA
jgi:fatty-acyl-CoA synthase